MLAARAGCQPAASARAPPCPLSGSLRTVSFSSPLIPSPLLILFHFVSLFRDTAHNSHSLQRQACPAPGCSAPPCYASLLSERQQARAEAHRARGSQAAKPCVRSEMGCCRTIARVSCVAALQHCLLHQPTMLRLPARPAAAVPIAPPAGNFRRRQPKGKLAATPAAKADHYYNATGVCRGVVDDDRWILFTERQRAKT